MDTVPLLGGARMARTQPLYRLGEPIVHRPAEALDSFLRTKMDVLVLGPAVIEKPVSDVIDASYRADHGHHRPRTVPTGGVAPRQRLRGVCKLCVSYLRV